MLSDSTHNGGFQERIICYILYKDDDYSAFLFRNESILILLIVILILILLILILILLIVILILVHVHLQIKVVLLCTSSSDILKCRVTTF